MRAPEPVACEDWNAGASVPLREQSQLGDSAARYGPRNRQPGMSSWFDEYRDDGRNEWKGQRLHQRHGWRRCVITPDGEGVRVNFSGTRNGARRTSAYSCNTRTANVGPATPAAPISNSRARGARTRFALQSNTGNRTGNAASA